MIREGLYQLLPVFIPVLVRHFSTSLRRRQKLVARTAGLAVRVSSGAAGILRPGNPPAGWRVTQLCGFGAGVVITNSVSEERPQVSLCAIQSSDLFLSPTRPHGFTLRLPAQWVCATLSAVQ